MKARKRTLTVSWDYGRARWIITSENPQDSLYGLSPSQAIAIGQATSEASRLAAREGVSVTVKVKPAKGRPYIECIQKPPK